MERVSKLVAGQAARDFIGRYDILGEIGRGGMGIIYRGEDKRIGRDVAIKTLTEVTPELRERFYVEARSGILSHPNIVTVYELGEHEGIPFIAMEYLQGDSLEKILLIRRRLPLLEVLPIVEQLCAGLGYAHQHGLVHRDVKPANVMVLPDGRVKIVDFGIARLTDQATRLTRPDALLGTFLYIAPERMRGEASDGRADIWSVGVMLYEMLTGALPFQGSDASALHRIMFEPYVPVLDLVKDVPAALTPILDRALAKDVAQRYSSMEEMAVDLHVVGEGLKQDRIKELFESARRLSGAGQFTSARTIVLQAQRIDPSNPAARVLLQEVQEQLGMSQRGKQLQELLEQAEDALGAKHFDEAIGLYAQAAKLDVEDTFGIAERTEQAQQAKEQKQKVRSLLEAANQARERGELMLAQKLLGQALEIDDKSTELRSAHAAVLRDVKRQQDLAQIENLLKAAREEYAQRRYTATLARLGEAAEIDPTHDEVQQLLFTATTRQKEERRRQLLDQVTAEVQDALEAEVFDLAHARVNQALETLPSETTLLRLKAEIERKRQEHDIEKLVRAAVLKAQELFAEEPVRALAVIEAALEQAPQAESLLQSRRRLQGQLSRIRNEEMRDKALQSAHLLLEASRYDEAIRELESAVVALGAIDELQALLGHAKQLRQQAARQQAREALWQQVQELLREEQYAKLLGLLQPMIGQEDDAALTGAFEEATRKLQELESRAAAVVERARAMGESDLAGALGLIAGQPDGVRESPAVTKLANELALRQEFQRAIAAAEARCDELLASGDFSRSMKGLEGLVQSHGDSAEIAGARLRCEAKRRDAADQLLQESSRSAKELLARGAGRAALRQVQKHRRLAPFASEPVRVQWQKLKDETTQTRGRIGRRASPAAVAASSRVGRDRLARMGVFGVVALGAIAAITAGLWHARSHKLPAAIAAPVATRASSHAPTRPPAVTAAPAGKLTYLEVNASPWATVVSIKNQSGEIVDLGAENPTTPMRLEGIAAGRYAVELRGTDGADKVVQCAVSEDQHLCTAEMGDVDVHAVLDGVQP